VRRMCVDYVYVGVKPHLHVANTHPTHVIIPNSVCAEPPEDG
jgi:hypothetical protein